MLRADRDQLVLAARPYVTRYLRSCARGYPEHVRDDMVAEGVASMFRSAETFDPLRCSFAPYASRRALGAAIDMLRHADHLTRHERRLHNEAVARAEAEHREPPSDQLAYAMDSIVPGTDGLTAADIVPSPSLSPEVVAAQHEQTAELHAAIRLLPIREAYVIDRYYFGQQTLTEIGHVLGVTESRCSQIHTRALAKLRHQRYGLSEEAA